MDKIRIRKMFFKQYIVASYFTVHMTEFLDIEKLQLVSQIQYETQDLIHLVNH